MTPKLNDSFLQPSSLREANLLRFVDWSHFHFIMPVMPDKAECSVVLCTALPGKPLQQRHLMAKNEFAFSFRSKRKDQQADGQYANVSC